MSVRLALLVALLVSSACGAPPKAIKLAPAPLPAPELAAIEADVARVRPWKLVAARNVAGVLFEEFQLGPSGPKLALSIDKDAHVATLQAHFNSVSKRRLEEEAAKVAKAADPIGAIAHGASAADRAYLALTFSPKIDESALELAARAVVRKNAVYSASGALERVAFLAAMKKVLEDPVQKDSVPKEVASLPSDRRLRREWAIDKSTPAEEVALKAAARVLADGAESRLARGLLAKDALRVDAIAGSRSFEIVIELGPGASSTTATSLVDREVRALARGETTGLEVETARTRVRAELLTELSGLESRAALAGGALLQEGGVAALFARYESVEKLDEKMLRAAVAKHLKPSMVSTR